MPANKDHGASKQFFKYIHNRQPDRKVVKLLDDKGVKGADGDDEAVAERFSEFFTSVFTVEIFGGIPTPIALFVANLAQEPHQSQVNSGNTRPNKEVRC